MDIFLPCAVYTVAFITACGRRLGVCLLNMTLRCDYSLVRRIELDIIQSTADFFTLVLSTSLTTAI
jgi:hypothetical protein